MSERLRFSEGEIKGPIPKDNEVRMRQTSVFAYESLHDPKGTPIPDQLDLPLPRESEWLHAHHEILKFGARAQPQDFERFHQRRRDSLLGFAEKIKRERRYDQLVSVIQGANSIGVQTNFGIYGVEVPIVYYLLCPPNRFLASIREKIRWKQIDTKNYSLNEIEGLWEIIPLEMIGALPFLDPGSADMVPDHFIHPMESTRISIPRTARTIEELLKEAFYNQRYVVPPEGAVVHLQKAGDLEQITMKERDGKIFAKARFTQGEGLVIISLDSASIKSLPIPILTSATENKHSLPRIVAEVYHDLVTAIEIPTLERKKRRRPDPQIAPPDKSHAYVYIPRIIRTGKKKKYDDPRLPYEGPERPREPHMVSGHVRNVPMTPEHKKVLKEFEEKTGLRVLGFVPEGSTFVRPHVSPTTTPESLRKLPQFIKRRIEKKLQANIREQAAKNKPTVVYQSN